MDRPLKRISPKSNASTTSGGLRTPISTSRACARAFASGDKLLQYNLNGHTYWSVDELTQLWELIGRDYGLPQLEVIDMRIEVRGDMAWVSHEAVIRRVAKPGGQLPPGAPDRWFRVRETEVLIRDDGAGNPVWKIWHHHCSMHAPDDEIRRGFQDTVLTRDKAR